MIDEINKWIDMGVKLATPVGVVIMLFLQSQFITRNEFMLTSEKLDTRIAKMEEVLIRMEARDEVDARHNKILDDHEARLRKLESK